MRRRDENKAKKWIGWFTIAIMVLSVLAFAASFVTQSSSQEHYNGYKFTQSFQTGEWVVEVNDRDYSFVHHPSQLSQLSVDSSIIDLLQESFEVTLSFDPELETPQYVDFARLKMAEFFALHDITPAQAVSKESEDYTLPVITCDDAKTYQPVMILRVANNTEARQEGNCIYLTSTTQRGLLELSEAVLYKFLGVIQ